MLSLLCARILAPATANVNWRATDQCVYNYLKQRRRWGAGLNDGGRTSCGGCAGPGTQRDVISNGYRRGLTDSVHNFSRELIAKGLKPPANYLCGRPIPTNSRRDVEGLTAVLVGGMEGISIFRAPDLLFARPTGTTCRSHSAHNTERRTDDQFEYIIF